MNVLGPPLVLLPISIIQGAGRWLEGADPRDWQGLGWGHAPIQAGPQQLLLPALPVGGWERRALGLGLLPPRLVCS